MNFSWTTFLFEVVNFVVLAFVLHRLLYAPLRKAIAKRQAENQQAREDAEKVRQEAVLLKQQLEVQAADMERQREEVLRQAREQAAAERQKLLGDAEQVSQRRQEEVRQALQLERDETLRSLRQEVVGLAIDLSQRLLLEATDSTLHRQLILRLVESLERFTDQERDRLRHNWHPEDAAILETANGVDDATLAHLNETVKGIVGRPVPVTLHPMPSLLGGVRLRLGGTVWDASLAGQLENVRREGSSTVSQEEAAKCLPSHDN